MDDKQWKKQRRLSLLGSNLLDKLKASEKPFSKIGEDVFEYRIYMGMSQTQFGDMCKLSLRTIQQIEGNPNHMPSRKTAYKIALGIHNNPIPEDLKPIFKIVDNWFDKKEINHG